MRIEQLRISNFRCFGPTPSLVDFGPEVTAFVGGNGSGKTAVLGALGKLFGVTTAQRTLRKTDFHVPPDRAEVAPETRLSIDCILGFPDPADDGDDPAVPELFRHMSVGGEGEPLRVRIRMVATWVDDGTPEGAVDEEVRWVATLGDDFDWDRCQRVTAHQRGLVQLVYVPASRNAFEQVTSLLKGRLWRAARWSAGLSRTAAQAATQVQAAFDAEVPARFITERLERRWDEVHQGDTDARPVLRLVENRLEDLVRHAEFVFHPDEVGQPRPLSDLSDGQRSLFHIALTAATLEIERDALAAPARGAAFDAERLRRTYLTVLAVEEPENSLSPFFLSRIMTQARDVGAMEGAQVVVTSHSASILGRVEPEEVRHCRLDPVTRSSSVRSLRLPPETSEASGFVRLAVRAYPELYFARYVVLAEGASEAIVLPRVAEAMGVHLDRSFVPVVPLGGRYVGHFWRLLEGLGIPYATLLDLDLGRRHGGANAIRSVVGELAAVGRDMARNRLAREGEIDPDEIDRIDDGDLLRQGQEHPWLKALRRERVYFSSPIDVDFAMLLAFPRSYMLRRGDRRGPTRGAEAVRAKKRTTLKTGGDPDLYGPAFDEAFRWYPYLFLNASKPDAHLVALSRIDDQDLGDGAPEGLALLVRRIRRSLRR